MPIPNLGTYVGDFNVDPQICVGPEGYVYIAWKRCQEICLRRSLDYGLTWEPTNFILSYPEDGILAYDVTGICCDSHGLVYVGWISFYDKNIMVSRSSDYGDTWENVAVSSYESNKNGMTISCDERGHVYTVWADDRYHDPVVDPYELHKNDVFFNYSEDCGLTWRSDKIMNDAVLADDHSPQLQCDNLNRVYIIWSRTKWSGEDNYTSIEFRSSSSNGLLWNEPKSIAGIPVFVSPVHFLLSLKPFFLQNFSILVSGYTCKG